MLKPLLIIWTAIACVSATGEKVLSDEDVTIAVMGNYSLPDDVDLFDLLVFRRDYLTFEAGVNDSNLVAAEKRFSQNTDRTVDKEGYAATGDQGQLCIDGQRVSVPPRNGDRGWLQPAKFMVSSGVGEIKVRAISFGEQGAVGIIGNFNHGIVTDERWQCASRRTHKNCDAYSLEKAMLENPWSCHVREPLQFKPARVLGSVDEPKWARNCQNQRGRGRLECEHFFQTFEKGGAEKWIWADTSRLHETNTCEEVVCKFTLTEHERNGYSFPADRTRAPTRYRIEEWKLNQDGTYKSLQSSVVTHSTHKLVYQVRGTQIADFYAALRDSCAREGFHASIHDCRKSCNPPCDNSGIKCPLTFCRQNQEQRLCKWRCGANTVLRNFVSAICVLLAFIALVCFCRAWGNFKNRYNALIMET